MITTFHRVTYSRAQVPHREPVAQLIVRLCVVCVHVNLSAFDENPIPKITVSMANPRPDWRRRCFWRRIRSSSQSAQRSESITHRKRRRPAALVQCYSRECIVKTVHGAELSAITTGVCVGWQLPFAGRAIGKMPVPISASQPTDTQRESSSEASGRSGRMTNTRQNVLWLRQCGWQFPTQYRN